MWWLQWTLVRWEQDPPLKVARVGHPENLKANADPSLRSG
jgi:hypothetical protein